MFKLSWFSVFFICPVLLEFTVVSDGEFKAVFHWCHVVIVSVDFLWCASVYSLHQWSGNLSVVSCVICKKSILAYSVSCGVLPELNIRTMCSNTAYRFEENIRDSSDWYLDLNKRLYIMLQYLPFCLKQVIENEVQNTLCKNTYTASIPRQTVILWRFLVVLDQRAGLGSRFRCQVQSLRLISGKVRQFLANCSLD